MKVWSAFLWCLFWSGACLFAEPTANFYLSPQGSDQWSGRLAEPNEARSDGPFATLTRARDAVRKEKAEKGGDIQVLVRGGQYPLQETVVFGLEDSGSPEARITYASYPNEKPVFTSGHAIEGWSPVEVTLAGLPNSAKGHVLQAKVSEKFLALYDEEGLLPRARSAGFIPTQKGSRTTIHCPPGVLKEWSNVEDVELVVRPHHAWILNILPLSSVDVEQGAATTSVAATYAMNPLHFLKETRSCWIENALEELDEPGEWVLNTKEGMVYYWPRNRSPVMAPQLLELIRVEGEIDRAGPKDVPVRNLRFRGLSFTQGDRYQVAANDAGLQHDWDFLDKGNALLRLRGTEDCVVEDCHFFQSGSGAIRVDLHGQRNQIVGNHIEDMGGAGIVVCGYGPGTKDVSRENLIFNNHVHHIGRLYWHSPGIMLWQSGENRVANNLIHHTPYSGMIVSGCMTDFFRKGNARELGRTLRRDEMGLLPEELTIEAVRPYLHSHENLIEYNEIHHVMELLGDGNAFYIRGAGAGNIFRRNYIHHLVTPMIMQCAIRTDGGQRDTVFSENLIYKCTSQGIMMKLNTRVENNIVADIIAPPRGYYLAMREGPATGGTILRNIFYSSGTECVFIDERGEGKNAKSEDRRGRKVARSQDAKVDRNIYFSAADQTLGAAMLAKQQKKGIDGQSRAVDPLFVDPANGDFRFRANSPALEMGIVPIDRTQMGLREGELSTDY